MNDIGKRVRAARLEAGITQAELAKQLGVHQTTVDKFEKRGIYRLSPERLKLLALALDKDPAWIMFGDAA